MGSRSFAVLVGALLLAGCSETQLGPVDDSSPGPLAPALDELPVAELRCSVDVAEGTLTCGGPAASPEGAAAAMVGSAIIGGQHQYARLVSSGVGESAGGDTVYASVTVQNLTLQPWATKDGVTPDGEVRVFFSEGPTVTAGSGAVAIVEDGSGIFTASDQPYIGYDAEFTDDGILEPAETSAAKQWRFAKDPTVTGFEFTVLIHASVPDVHGLAVDLVQIAAGGMHTCGISADNAAYCWGANGSGQLGTGDHDARLLPTPVAGGLEFKEIAPGHEHTCALTTTGRAYCWGLNDDGQLGNETRESSNSPVQVAQGRTFVDIFAGSRHTCAVQPNADAYCWGYNGSAQVGSGTLIPVRHTSPQKVINTGYSRIFAGQDFSCALASTALCWGNNIYGQLGRGNNTPNIAPNKVLDDHAFITGDASDHAVCAATAAGDAYCWGIGSHGKLGNGVDDGNRNAPTRVSFPEGVVVTDVAIGAAHACAIADGDLYCWGSDAAGQLGDGGGAGAAAWTPIPVDLGLLEEFGSDPAPADVSIGFAGSHTCAMSTTGRAYCWGDGSDGQLGDGFAVNRYRPVWVAGTQ